MVHLSAFFMHCFHLMRMFDRELAKLCRYSTNQYDSPHTKAFLLLQAHFSRLPLPCTDYITDLKSVLDQAIRIIQVRINLISKKVYTTY